MLDIEHMVEEDHPARAIWELVGKLDLSGFSAAIHALEGAAGRPAYDPRLLISLWIYAYSRGIGSAREVERRCDHDPAFRWLAGLLVINHHTLSDFRLAHRDALDLLFTQVLGVLSVEGLIALKTVMHDGTKIAADAGRNSFRGPAQIEKHLATAQAHVAAMGDPRREEESSRQAAARNRARREQIERLERALVEARQVSAAKPKGYSKANRQQTGVSVTDPKARIMRHADGHYASSYNVQISTDADAGIAIGVHVGQTAPDYEYLAPAITQIKDRIGRLPEQMVVDGGYTSSQNILMTHGHNIELVGPWVQTDGRARQRFARAGVTDGFLPEKFHYDLAGDVYICPQNKRLTACKDRVERPGRTILRYKANWKDCVSCSSRAQCCSGNARYGRSIVITLEDPIISAFRSRQATPRTKALLRDRGRVAELPNAWLKEKLGLRRFHVRGLKKVTTEALWAVLTYNIQQWTRLRWRPRLQKAPT